MSFRARLALASAGAVAAAIVISSVAGYVLVRKQLRDQVDNGLRDRAAQIMERPDHHGEGPGNPPPPAFGGPAGISRLVFPNGTVHTDSDTDDTQLPVGDATIAVARGVRQPFFSDVHAGGAHLRVLTTPYDGLGALQVARPLTEVDNTLERLRLIGLFAMLVGVGLAALAGLAVARAAAAPVRRLSDAAEEIARTGDPSRRVGVEGNDEIGRLGASFDAMLAALDGSLQAQRQLVADASHELRTPLTSLRTNVELLARDDLPESDRRLVLSAATLQLEELTTLMEDLVAVAREGESDLNHEDVQLDAVVEDAVERSRTHAPGLTFESDLEPTVVKGAPDMLARAVANLLDNASRWSPEGGVVEVTLHGGELVVRDHGPGIDPVDLPHVFDRFYRAPAARKQPGSGLGLAIVQRVADEHGATVTAENADGGGALFRLRFLPAS